MKNNLPSSTLFISDKEEVIKLLRESPGKWNNLVFYKIDFRDMDILWERMECEGSTFVACVFAFDTPLPLLMARGALFLHKLPDTPYDPYKKGLYCPEELMESPSGEYEHTLDSKIYQDYLRNSQGSLLDFFSRWIHDYCVQVALDAFLKPRHGHERKVVGIMGGHSKWRDNPGYKDVAEIARAITREGYCIASGGGPGAMEAANLGAWMAPYPDEALDEAVAILASAPEYTSPDYLQKAWEIKTRFPQGAESLSVPTWFYGHEPTNIFASSIAKFFNNSIREDGLLTIANYGVIYTQGKAGTVQEIFMDATQNHYGAFKYVSPMIFFGKDFFTTESGIIPVLEWLSKGQQYADLITVTDDKSEVVQAVKNYKLLEYRP